MSELMEKIKVDANRILNSEHSMDLKKYMERWLPLHYPNKGLRYMVKKGAVVEVYHEQFNLHSFFRNTEGQTIEVVIDYYGNTHQRDYCLVVLGHRFQGRQTIQFRGILGQNRLYKILLMLYLAGVPENQVIFYDSNPDYRTIIRHDLSSLNDSFDHIVFGGDVIVKPFLSSRFRSLFSNCGDIVSWSVFNYEGKKVLFTSYPYGDLSEYVVEAFGPKVNKLITFIGSTGALRKDFSLGEIIIPMDIYDDTSLVTANFSNYLITKTEKINVKAKVSSKHLSIKTPLLETTEMVSVLKKQGYESVDVDVEVAYFQRGCEQSLANYPQVGVILFVSDRPGSESDLSKHDYSSEKILHVRQDLARIVEEIQKNIVI